MKKNSLFLIILIIVGCSHAPGKKDVVFQNAPINALMAGCYSGTTSVGELKKHGDFGIGTLDALDGELIVLDHSFYQVRSDGKAYLLDDKAVSPFATMTFFNADQKFHPGEVVDYKGLTGFLDEKLKSFNLVYAIKVEGKFSALKVRSPPRQTKPYPPLTEAIKEQKVFELTDQEGTLVGFRCPPYMTGVNVAGYHFHFLSRDRTVGGHVLDLRIEDPRIEIDETRGFSMQLPANEEFLKFRFDDKSQDAIRKVEK